MNMKGFALNEVGDLVIENNQIPMVNGNELIQQTVASVIKTNKDEWFLNLDEGIDFSVVLGKNKAAEEIIKNEIEEGLSQVDSSFFIDTFSCNFDENTRKLTVKFTAKNENGDTIEGENVWD